MTNAYNATNVVSGPAVLQKGSTPVSFGHTAGGIDLDIKPNVRMQNVDYWGKTGVNVINQGDDAKIKAPLAEWTALTIQNTYGAGNDQTALSSVAYMGLGRSAGFRLIPFLLTVLPLLASDALKKVTFNRAVPVGELKLSWIADKDRVFEMEYAALVDETATDGEVLGKIFVGN